MVAWLRSSWPRLLALALCIALPLWVFGAIAEDVHEREPFTWEVPLMLKLRADAPSGFRVVALAFSWLGSLTVMLPASLLIAALLWRKSHAMARFFVLGVGGAMLLNVLFKSFFQRARPDVLVKLWTEKDYSFPSGHATMAMALVATLVALVWRTRWRIPVTLAGGLYVLLMGLARVYVGVHYPTDVIGGWAAGLAWVGGVALISWPRLRRAQQHARQPGTFGDAQEPPQTPRPG